MSGKPTKARIRSYNVGFGDCFLLTFSYEDDKKTRNVLIDFGSTKRAEFGPEGGMLAIAEKIRKDSGGKLDIVVATHRHSDHISGFDGEPGKVIAALEPELVVQPWTEDPNLAPDAQGPPAPPAGGDGAHALVARLANLHDVVGAVCDEIPRLEASKSVRKAVREQLQFLGETNIKNAGAVQNLMTMGKRPPVYASFGSTLPVADLLPGVDLEVLGPPTLKQSKEVAKQRAKDPDEFWHLAGQTAATLGAGDHLPRLFPDAEIAEENDQQEARWVIPELERMRSEEMLAIVRILDSVLNNTSLILLFEVDGKRLLFPGDAQIENWSYALFTAPKHEEIVQRLASATFYKVGHHGSLNATPKSLWKKFQHAGGPGTPDRLTTMVSTAPGKHGHVEDGTEVPRTVLLHELDAKSDFHDTEELNDPDVFWNDVVVDF